LARLGFWLIEPRAALPELEQSRARLLSGLLLWLFLGLILLVLLPAGFSPLGSLAYPRVLPALAGALAAVAVLYGLARGGKVRAALMGTVLMAALTVWLVVLLNRENEQVVLATFPYLLVSVLLASLLLSTWATVALALAHMAGGLLLIIVSPQLALSDFRDRLFFVGVLAMLIVVGNLLRQRALAQLDEQTRALKESEQRFRLLFAASPDAIVLIDPQGRWPIVDCNEIACQMNGYTREAMVGQSVDLLNEAPGTPVERAVYLERLRREGTIHFETLHRHKAGHLFPVEISTSLVTFMGRELVLGIDRDISERKRIEAALARERYLMQTLMASVLESIYFKDRQGRFVAVSQTQARRLGLHDPAEALGKTEEDLLAYHAPFVAEDEQAVMATGRPIIDKEEKEVWPDGRAAWMLTTKMPWRNTDGEIIGTLGISRDITERKAAQSALEEANAELTRSLGELEQRTRELDWLRQMGDQLQACRSVDEAYAVFANLARQLFAEEAGALCLLSASRNVVEAVALWGPTSPASIGEHVFGPDDCWALRRGRPHLVEDKDVGLPCRHLGLPAPATYICQPMMAQGEAMGVLHVQHTSPQHFTEARQRLVQTVADSVALALANLNLRETLRQQSIRDSLTGLFNRRYLEETMEREVRRVTRTEHSLGLIMLDLDHFKRFNDDFGHEAGDALLRELGAFLRVQVRGEDIVCRYGGEEFVLVLPEASREVTRQRAELVREGIKHLHVHHMGQALGPLTLSLGVAVYPEHGLTAVSLLRAADAALYRAKREGRDRVMLAE
jgi:diguanylate cyclase (GGDEF)-like protein/PAS domain S-box-containing protein